MPTIATATPSKMPQTSKNGEIPNRPSNHHPRIAPPLILTATNHPMIERRARTGATELRPLTSRSEPIRSPDSAREDRSSFSRSPFRIWTFVPSSTLNYKQHYTKLITLIQKLLQKSTPKHSLNITATPHHLCSTRTSTISRHTGFKAVSTGSGDNKITQPYSPSPLMGEESKVRVKRQNNPDRHSRVGGNLGGGVTTSPKQAINTPSPIKGEETKSLSQCLTRDQRVTARKTPTLCHSEQSEESRRPVPSYWL